MSDTLRVNLRKGFAGANSSGPALTVDTEIAMQGVTVLFGESGAGKSTLLRCIAGLDESTGSIGFGSEIWQDERSRLAPHLRRVGMVFQHRQLFAHRSVADNLRYAQKRCKATGTLSSRQELEDLFQISAFQGRMPNELSGGEQQRVAIVRALLSQPRLLLLDEPLSALDIRHRSAIMRYLVRLKHSHSLPMIYVTHDLSEAANVADNMIQLSDGQVLAAGPLKTLLTDPQQDFCSRVDARSVIEGRHAEYRSDWRLSRIDFDDQSLWVPAAEESNQQIVRTQIAARDVSISLTPISDGSIVNQLQAIVTHVLTPTTDSHATVRLKVGNTPLLAHITRRSLSALSLQAGMRVTAQVKAVALY